MKLLIMQSFPASRHLQTLGPKYTPQHLVLNQPHSTINVLQGSMKELH